MELDSFGPESIIFFGQKIPNEFLGRAIVTFCTNFELNISFCLIPGSIYCPVYWSGFPSGIRRIPEGQWHRRLFFCQRNGLPGSPQLTRNIQQRTCAIFEQRTSERGQNNVSSMLLQMQMLTSFFTNWVKGRVELVFQRFIINSLPRAAKSIKSSLSNFKPLHLDIDKTTQYNLMKTNFIWTFFFIRILIDTI